MWNPNTCGCECNKATKIDKLRLIGKLVFECEDEILNTTETLSDDKNVTCKECNCLIHIISNKHFYYLLLLLNKRLDRKRTLSIILTENE